MPAIALGGPRKCSDQIRGTATRIGSVTVSPPVGGGIWSTLSELVLCLGARPLSPQVVLRWPAVPVCAGYFVLVSGGLDASAGVTPVIQQPRVDIQSSAGGA